MYTLYKQHFTCEKYLCINTSHLRNVLAQFRCGSHRLNIETGRYMCIPREDRKCNVCNLSCIEDEFHFVLICKGYVSLRREFIPKHFYIHPTKDKFYSLMSTKNVTMLYNLAIYLYRAMYLRDLLLSTT